MNASEFGNESEELAFYADFLIYVVTNLDGDNAWLIQKLVENNKRSELLEKALLLHENSNFVKDLEITFHDVNI